MAKHLHHGIAIALVAGLTASAAPALAALADERRCGFRFVQSEAGQNCRLSVVNYRGDGRDQPLQCIPSVLCPKPGDHGTIDWTVRKIELPLDEVRDLRRCEDGQVATKCPPKT